MGVFDWLKSAVGMGSVLDERAPRRTADPHAIIEPLPLSLQLQRVGGGLTPAQVSQIIRLADTGYMYQLVDLANEMRQKDCHLQSVLQTREIAVQSLRWQIRPCSGTPRKKDRTQAEAMEDALKACPAFESLIGHLSGGDYYGFAVAETILAKDGGLLVPKDFSLLSQRRFVFDIADGCLRWWDAYGGSSGPYPGVDLKATYPGRFIQFQPRIVGDIACREGLVRPLMWAALFRNWTISDWLKLAELAWKPWRIGKYAKGSPSEDINNLRSVLQNMVSSGVALVDKEADVDIHWPVAAGGATGRSAHQSLVDAMGAEMSKAVLGQTETTQSSSSSGYAQAKVHNEIRKDIRDARARAIATCVRQELLTPLVQMNYGPDASVPDFQFLTDDAVDQVAFSNMLVNVRKVKLRVPAKWARERLGIPEPDDDDELVGSEEGEEDQAPDPNGADDGEDIPIDPATGLPKEPAEAA